MGVTQNRDFGEMICTPFTGQISERGVFYAL